MAKDRQEIIAVLDLRHVQEFVSKNPPSYRETIADALMALPEVDEPLRELLSYCKTEAERLDSERSNYNEGYEHAMTDAAERLAGILDGER